MLTFFRRLYSHIIIQFFIKCKRYDKAEKFTKRYLNRKGDESLNHYLLAQIYKLQDNVDKAIDEYEFFFQQNKASLPDYVEILSLHFKKRNFKRVIALSARLLEKGQNKMEGAVLEGMMDDIYWYLCLSHYYIGEEAKSRNFLSKIKKIAQEMNVKEY